MGGGMFFVFCHVTSRLPAGRGSLCWYGDMEGRAVWRWPFFSMIYLHQSELVFIRGFRMETNEKKSILDERGENEISASVDAASNR